MASSVYIETSVISYLVARTSHDVVTAARQAITAEWWNERRQSFDLFISALVEEEIASGELDAASRRLHAVSGIPSLAVSDRAEELAGKLIVAGALPIGSPEDALHIGIAAANGVEFLLTWNFKHINNAQTKAAIAEVIEGQGFLCPILCSPEELGD